jgi:hypothetical protein
VQKDPTIHPLTRGPIAVVLYFLCRIAISQIIKSYKSTIKEILQPLLSSELDFPILQPHRNNSTTNNINNNKMGDSDDTVNVVVRYETQDYELQVDPNTETMADIRKTLEEKTGLAVKDQDLSFTKRAAMIVDDKKTLADYRFNGGCFMELKKK